MKTRIRKYCFIATVLFLPVSSSSVFASGEWQLLQDKSAIEAMLRGRGLDSPSFADYYREDGVMGYYNKTYDSTVVRIWKVEEGGKICTYIYFKPDRLVECYTLERSSSDAELLRMTILDRGYKSQARLVGQPLQTLIDEVNSTTDGNN